MYNFFKMKHHAEDIDENLNIVEKCELGIQRVAHHVYAFL